MARNEEKAQSMLYRFREAKAMEMGLVSRQDRRPRMAAHCKDLRQCEKWRGEILREISRKVTKIQDYGLTDYEVRDLNDEINKLMREKGHWENQIMALGGANYRRAAPAMLGKDGKEVPGMRGYKYFGRARELPGVKELFENASKDQDELTSYKRQNYANYQNVGPEYYGDLGPVVEDLLQQAEKAAEEEEWEDALADVADTLGIEAGSLNLQPIPRADYISLPQPRASTSSAESQDQEIPPPPPNFPSGKEVGDAQAEAIPAVGSKRKTRSATSVEDGESSKAAKKTGGQTTASEGMRIFTVLREEDLRQPELPTFQDLEKMLVDRQKEELLKEYV